MADGRSKRGLRIGLGVVMVVAGLVGAILLWNGATTRRSDAVADFARAPVGCDTTLDFAEPGTYTVFLEREGTVDDVRGDCDVDGGYDVGEGDVDVELTVIDPDSREVDLDDASTTVSYSVDGFVGESFMSIDIDEDGDHVLRVESADDGPFVIAVGRDPDGGVALLRGGAIAAGVVGLLAGLTLVAFGGRKCQEAVTPRTWPSAVPNADGGPWGASAPPYGAVNQPPYGQPTQPPYLPGPGSPTSGAPGREPSAPNRPAPVRPQIPGQPGFHHPPHDSPTPSRKGPTSDGPSSSRWGRPTGGPLDVTPPARSDVGRPRRSSPLADDAGRGGIGWSPSAGTSTGSTPQSTSDGTDPDDADTTERREGSVRDSRAADDETRKRSAPPTLGDQ